MLKRIAFTGGGSGGHVYPIIAVKDKLLKQGGLEFHYFGPRDTFSGELAANGFEMHYIAAGKWRRYFSVLNFLDIFSFFFGFIQALFKLYALMPDVLFSKGGSGALPVVWAAWFYRVPVMIHDSDAVPGLTNLLSARFAKRIALSFADAEKYFPPRKVVLTGNPVRTEIVSGLQDAGAAKAALGFDATKPLLLILGGSQGMERVNRVILEILSGLAEFTQVLHQTGANNFLEVEKLSQAALLDVQAGSAAQFRYLAVPFLDITKMRQALAAADLIVSRAGSGSIFEIAAAGKPGIFVPLKGSANDHQRANAYAYAASGGAVVIEEDNLSPQILLGQVHKLLASPPQLSEMGQKARSFAHPEAADLIAQEIIGLA